MSNEVEELRKNVVELERVYRLARDRLAKAHPTEDAVLMQDAQGRYILLDALETLVRARVELSRLGLLNKE